MNKLKTEFVRILNGAAKLLLDCEIEERASWFMEQVDKLQSSDSESTLTDVATSVRSSVAGMGSFSDLSSQPSHRCLKVDNMVA